MIRILFLMIVIVFSTFPSFAKEVERLKLSFESQVTDEDIDRYSKRLEEIVRNLQSPMPTNEKAELLYEKSKIMLIVFWVTGLRTGTESLLEAIEFAPKNKEYLGFLCQVYDNLWKDRNFEDGGELSGDFQNLKEKVRARVSEYRK